MTCIRDVPDGSGIDDDFVQFINWIAADRDFGNLLIAIFVTFQRPRLFRSTY